MHIQIIYMHIYIGYVYIEYVEEKAMTIGCRCNFH